MGRKPKLHIPDNNNIENLISSNCTIYKIQKELSPLIGGDIAYYVIENYIKTNYNKSWDKKSKCWIYCDQEESINNLDRDIDCGIDTISQSSEKISTDVNTLIQLSKEVNNNVNSMPESFKEIKNILNAILTKTVKLEQDISSIKNQLKNFSIDKSSQDTQLPEKMITIWNSSKSKKSISVNKELVNEVQQLFSKLYGINNNDSKVIDTALLLSLLQHSK